MSFLAVSIVGSIALTVLLNVALRSPRLAGRLDNGMRRLMERSTTWDAANRRSPTRVFVPWKAMLAASLLLTIVLNLAIRLV